MVPYNGINPVGYPFIINYSNNTDQSYKISKTHGGGSNWLKSALNTKEFRSLAYKNIVDHVFAMLNQKKYSAK